MRSAARRTVGYQMTQLPANQAASRPGTIYARTLACLCRIYPLGIADRVPALQASSPSSYSHVWKRDLVRYCSLSPVRLYPLCGNGTMSCQDPAQRDYCLFQVARGYVVPHSGRARFLSQTLSSEETVDLRCECLARHVSENVLHSLAVIVRHPNGANLENTGFESKIN